MSLCEFCVSFDPAQAQNGKLYLPDRSLLFQKALRGCGGCRSFKDLLEATLPPGIQPNDNCQAFLEIDPTLSTEYGDIRYELPESTASRIIVEKDREERPQIPGDPTAEDCHRLVRSWEKNCRAHGCSARQQVPLPKRIIKVPIDDTFPQLYDTCGERGTYIALTHCWGKTPMKRLVQELEAEWRNGINPSSLSRNFQDALKITKLLGYSYIWIDALCIVQDSKEDWDEQAPKMAGVYGYASLVLSAAYAVDNTEGFLGYRPSVASPNLGSSSSYSVSKAFLVNGEGEMAATMEHIYKGIIDISPLNSRGWCAQERILATRILHYTPYGMIWECSNAYWPELHMPQIQMDHLYQGRYNTTMDKQKHNFPGFIDAWLHKKQQGRQCNPLITENNTDAALGAWSWCISEYAPRDLTMESDKLPAIAALAELFSDGLGDYLGGIWSNSWQRTLSWGSAVVTFPKTARAPSWSWASVDGGIIFDCEWTHSAPWTICEGNILLEHHFVPGRISNPYMDIGLGSYLALDCRCINARSVPLDGEVHYLGYWDNPEDNPGGGSIYNWPSVQEIPEKLILLPLQEQQWLQENKPVISQWRLFALLLREANQDDLHSQKPTFRRVGWGNIYIGPKSDGNLSAEILHSNMEWEQQRFTLI
jgi:hypothetical protein